MMATRKCIQSPNRKLKFASSSETHLHIGGVPFAINKELLASKSAKVAGLMKENPRDDFAELLKDIPVADAETFELVARFCHGYEVKISTENVFHIACLAHYLGMTENHSTNNLLRQALNFFERQVLHSWNKSIRALKSAENILQQAVHLGLVDECVESIIRMVLQNPSLLGEPFKNDSEKYDENNVAIRPNVRRKLFAVLDFKSEDLTVMSLMLYEPIIHAMIQRKVPVEFVSASVYQYAKRWVLSSLNEGDESSIYKRNSQREIIEAVERLLPIERALLPCNVLFEMLNSAIVLDSRIECRSGFEVRIGKQLDMASVDDFMIPFKGNSKEEQYDVECLKRILKNFYHNYTGTDSSGLIAVAELMEKLLAEIASDIELKMSTFISIAELSIAASAGIQQTSDAIYRAIDIYLDNHRYLTESEREEVCRVLDCNKMSPEAQEHAAQNARLPLRVVVQVLFVGQLKLRDAMPKEVNVEKEKEEDTEKESSSTKEEEEEEEEEEEVIFKAEMEKMSSKVMELEKECLMMKRELESNGICRRSNDNNNKNEKVKVWKEMKRKFGCMSISNMHDCNCNVKKKKVYPR